MEVLKSSFVFQKDVQKQESDVEDKQGYWVLKVWTLWGKVESTRFALY